MSRGGITIILAWEEMLMHKSVWRLKYNRPIIRLLINGLVTYSEKFPITFKPQRRKLVVI
jgi:hypothetical protein